jgi:sterol desaturase/sphingolipid hydroxylase (fatty acid hydroxylase superfamily)
MNNDILNWLTQHLEEFSTLMLVIILVEIPIDFVASQQREYKETAANFGVGIVHEILSSAIAIVLILSGLSFFSTLSPFVIPVNIGTVLLAILIGDFIYYWNHVTEHRIRFFWAYHSVHHSSTDFNLSVALRLAWIEDFILWIFYIPMVLMGFHPLVVLLSLEIIGLYQVWIHTQKIGRLGILDEFLNTPSLHRVHHGTNRQYIDKNYGGILCIWDKLFGTYEPEQEKVVYGLTKNIGTQNLIKINIIEYLRIWSDIKQSQNLGEVWNSVFGSLAWKPRQAELSDIHSLKVPYLKRLRRLFKK